MLNYLKGQYSLTTVWNTGETGDTLATKNPLYALRVLCKLVLKTSFFYMWKILRDIWNLDMSGFRMVNLCLVFEWSRFWMFHLA